MSCKCSAPGACPWHQAITDEDTQHACQEGQPPAAAEVPPCIYLATARTGRHANTRDGQRIYNCRLHGECSLAPSKNRIANCRDCGDYTAIGDQNIAARFVDTLRITDRTGHQTHALRNLLAGRSAFLVCGGPSVKEVDYQVLRERGIFSLAVNNAAGFVPASAFVCSDPPMKFHHGIFLDPKVIKLLPIPKLHRKRGKLREKLPDGNFRNLNISTPDCPNTFGFERRSWLMPDATWFTEPGAAWGNHQKGVDMTGQPKTVCTALLGLRLLQYLGARRVFLLGVDFFMDPRRGLHENYAFGEEKEEHAVHSNNRQYEIVNEWLCQLRPVFERFGFETYNTNAKSHLRAFDHVPFDVAVRLCRGDVPAEPWDLAGWYKK